MSRRTRVFAGNPRCPKCGQPTFDLHRVNIEKDGIQRKSTVWWCGNTACDVNEKNHWLGGFFYTLDDIEAFDANPESTYASEQGT